MVSQGVAAVANRSGQMRARSAQSGVTKRAGQRAVDHQCEDCGHGALYFSQARPSLKKAGSYHWDRGKEGCQALGRIVPVADTVCLLKAPLILPHCLEKNTPVRYHKNSTR